jgi:predicted DNA-binding transcriptional regulator YafY
MSAYVRRGQLALPDVPVARRRRDDGSRYEQIVRILRLMQRIDGRAYCPPLQQLAADLEVCTRTVRRYLDALSLAGVFVPPLLTEYLSDEQRGGAR